MLLKKLDDAWKNIQDVLVVNPRNVKALVKRGRILLERRPPSGIGGGLWSLPELDPAFGPDELQEACEQKLGLDCDEPELISGFRHTFSHYHLHIQPARLGVTGQNTLRDDGQQKWLHRHEALSLGLPAPIRTLLTNPEQGTLPG